MALGACKRPPPPAHSQDVGSRKPTAKTAAKKEPAARHLSAKGCSGCHPDHYNRWKRSMHAMAHHDPVYDFYFMKASRQSGKKLETFCGRCHTPLGVEAGSIPFGHPLKKRGDTRVAPLFAEGVQCDFCHTITGHTRVANSGFVFKASTAKGGPLADARPVSHGARHAPYFRSAELCGTCHQVVHPGNGILLETTYGEWKKSPYAKAGIVCQDCHMTDGLEGVGAAGPRDLGKPARHPGKAATMAKKRPHVSRHYFVGPNLIFNRGPEAAAMRKASEALLRRAGTVAIGEARRHRGAAVIPVIVSNTGAGHNLPTGITELRQLWLEVKVTGAGGRVLLHSGALDSAGNIKPGAVIYRTEVHDAQGKDTTLFWNTVRKASDRRIPPLSSLTEQYVVQGGGARGKVKVEAALHYRSVSPAGLAEAEVPAGTVTLPVFTIARSTRTLKL